MFLRCEKSGLAADFDILKYTWHLTVWYSRGKKKIMTISRAAKIIFSIFAVISIIF